MRPAFLIIVTVLLLPLHAGAQEVATVTLLDGSLRVIRGTAVLTGGAGVRLRQGDIIESSNSGFVQLEFAQGPIVALGPSTRLFLFSVGTVHNGETTKEKLPAGELMLLSGWIKGEGATALGTYQYATQPLAATTRNGTLILHASSQSAEVFVESGSATLVEVDAQGGRGRASEAKAGQFFSRQARGSVTTKARPELAFVDSMPRQFKDTLPSRMSRSSGKATEAKHDHEVTYAEIQPWLGIGRVWRKNFVQRFQPRLTDAGFRKSLEADLAAHPEWDPVIHPEKYHPKTTEPSPRKSDAQDRRNSQ